MRAICAHWFNRPVAGVPKPRRFDLRLGGKATIQLAVSLFLACTTWGCVIRTDLMDYRSQAGFDVEVPRPGNSLVIFFRPGRMAGAFSSSVFDDLDLVAVLMDYTYTVYETKPGKHRFMVLGEAADFMDADLAENKVYFATVTPRFGVWRARFSLKPITPHDPEWQQVRDWMSQCTLVTLNAAGRSWAQDNSVSIREKHDAYLSAWLSKDERPALYPSDGVALADVP
jgi:hypothetical protein